MARIEEADGIASLHRWSTAGNPLAETACAGPARVWLVASTGGAIAVAALFLLLSGGLFGFAALGAYLAIVGFEAGRRYVAAARIDRFVRSGSLAEVVASRLAVDEIVAGLAFPWLRARRRFLVSFTVAVSSTAVGFMVAGRVQGFDALFLVSLAWIAYGFSLRGGAYWLGYDEFEELLSGPSLIASVRGSVRFLSGPLMQACLFGLVSLVDLGPAGPSVQSFGTTMVAGFAAHAIRTSASRRVRDRVGRADDILRAALERAG